MANGHVFDGNSWRNATEEPERKKTRAELQQQADHEYAMGRMTEDEWTAIFWVLSGDKHVDLRALPSH